MALGMRLSHHLAYCSTFASAGNTSQGHSHLPPCQLNMSPQKISSAEHCTHTHMYLCHIVRCDVPLSLVPRPSVNEGLGTRLCTSLQHWKGLLFSIACAGKAGPRSGGHRSERGAPQNLQGLQEEPP